mmetsp:Transcript_40035/g.80776  ORF Transcript_40035/g.80776 Transcript_40035/m.80776 type:complete len:275 (-) Transcript_40035:679-1503(-)
MLSHSLMAFLVVAWSDVKMAMLKLGPSAAKRVTDARCHGLKRRDRKPSITTCPAKVVDMVEACPAASNPTAHVVFPSAPIVDSRAAPAPSKPISAHRASTPCGMASLLHASAWPRLEKESSAVEPAWLGSKGTQAMGVDRPWLHSALKKKCAKVPTTARLTKKDVRSAMPDSMAEYVFASATASALVRSNEASEAARVFTKPLWRYKLCGMMTAPRVPMATTKPDGTSRGTANPLATDPTVAAEAVAKKLAKKHPAMSATNAAIRASKYPAPHW